MAARTAALRSRPVRIAVGIATLGYALYLLLTLGGLLVLAGYTGLALLVGGESISALRLLLKQVLSLQGLLPVHLCSLLLEVGLLIFYLVHTITNTEAKDTIRVTLGIGHLFLPFVAMPVYYYLYIWRDAPPHWAVADRETRSM